MNASGREGRCLGLIGGLGPGATVYYYRGLLAAHAAAGKAARLLIAHADVNHVRAFVENDDRAGLARYLAGLVSSLSAGGAEMGAIVAITPHICAAELTAISPLPDRHSFRSCCGNPSAAPQASGPARHAVHR
jgi:aspartate racemase